jgi:hypothetical protein
MQIQLPKTGQNTRNPEHLIMSADKVLAIVLRVSAGVLLLAIVPIFFPYSLMASINRAIGLSELPDTALVGYLTRSLSALYAFHGALLMFLSFDVRRYLPLIKFYAAVSMLFGAVLLGLDIYLRMPVPWIIGEGPMIIMIYCVILGLAARVK